MNCQLTIQRTANKGFTISGVHCFTAGARVSRVPNHEGFFIGAFFALAYN